MANVLDLRRRIRSVKNTRQITKAMKMVSAARLRRAQERMMAARPYAKMITSVLESLTRRIEIFDPETGNLRHPLFATREEKRVLRGGGQRRQRICRRVQRQHREGRISIHRRRSGQGVRHRGGGPQGPRHRCAGGIRWRRVRRKRRRSRGRQTRRSAASAKVASRSQATIPACCSSWRARRVFELAENIISRYIHEEIDAAYIVYNEFKSVISQRVVVEKSAAANQDRRAAGGRRCRAHPGGTRARGRGRYDFRHSA